VTALALRRTAWGHPELAASAVAAGAWALVAGHALAAPHAGAEPYLPGLSGWVAMATAMMLPGALADVRRLALSSMWRRRQRTIALFLGVYVTVWTAFGAVALAALPALGVSAAALLACAAAWELTPWKWRAVRRCHLIEPLPPRGARADAACARAGFRYGALCVASCWPAMLAMAAAGHMALALMATLAALATAEKLVVRSARLRGPAAAVLAGAALLALV
jgi:predicted metal-binding membrane protein